jgi:hypothetical protein
LLASLLIVLVFADITLSLLVFMVGPLPVEEPLTLGIIG